MREYYYYFSILYVSYEMTFILLCINLDIYSSGPLDIQRARIPNSVSPHATLDIGNDRYKFVTILVF